MKTRNVAAIGGMVLAWSAYYLLSKWCVGWSGSPYVAGMLLRSFAFLFLTAYMLLKGNFKRLAAVKGQLPLLMLIGVLGFLLDLFANLGFTHGSVSAGTALLKTDILMATLVSALFFKEKLTAVDLLLTAVMLCGVLMLLGVFSSRFTFNVYDCFFILSAAAVTANAFLIKGVKKKYNTDSEVIAYYNNAVVLVLFTVATLVGGTKGLTAPVFSPTVVLLIALGGFAQALNYLCYYYNLKKYPVWLVKVILLLVPVVSAIVGAVALNERLNGWGYAGAALVLFGAAGLLLHHGRGAKATVNRGVNAEKGTHN